MAREFTGKTMAAVMVGGFGIVIAVNLTMASYAVSGFSGVVVENSYVASQKFNAWLDTEEQQQALGWEAQVERSGDRLTVITSGVPAGATVQAQIRRPLGQPDSRVLELATGGDARFVSDEALPAGRWIVRLSIQSGSDIWRSEGQIQ